MAKKSKGFGELLKQQNKSQALPKITIKAPTVQETDKSNNDISNLDEQEIRIGQILGLTSEGEISAVNKKTLTIYRDYLKKELESPCIMTGIEDFKWEEYYMLGGGSKEEHDKLRKTKPSYLDSYKLLNFTDEIDTFYGLMVSVKRESDNKKFILPLSDLESDDSSLNNEQLLNDYSVWFVNWR